jgi:hypothetical protein
VSNEPLDVHGHIEWQLIKPSPPAPSECLPGIPPLGQSSPSKIRHPESSSPVVSCSSSLLGGSPRLLSLDESPKHDFTIFSEVSPKHQERTPSPVHSTDSRSTSSHSSEAKSESHLALDVSQVYFLLPFKAQFVFALMHTHSGHKENQASRTSRLVFFFFCACMCILVVLNHVLRISKSSLFPTVGKHGCTHIVRLIACIQ